MAKIPSGFNEANKQTEIRINNEEIVQEHSFSNHFPFSNIGHACDRFLQYSYRNAFIRKITRKTKRIFDFGNFCEDLVINSLKGVGIQTTDQQKEIIEIFGCWKGKIDGIETGVLEAPKSEHLLEIKSHNERNFENLIRTGIEKAHKKHYLQMMIYMHFLKIKRGLYAAINKNTSEIYLKRIIYNKEIADQLEQRGKDLVLAETLFDRISNDPMNYNCRFCNANDICYGRTNIQPNCRTCRFSNIYNDNIWKCSFDNNLEVIIPFEKQIVGCDLYQYDEVFFK